MTDAKKPDVVRALVPNSVYAKIIGVTPRTLWNYEATGRLSPAKRINGRKFRDPNERPRFDDVVA
ncbi:MAG: hypothetical protein M3O26_10620 [Pseudomonadota bacterium]|nr:hypothetical protein [Pseudomonadota bacterium]